MHLDINLLEGRVRVVLGADRTLRDKYLGAQVGASVDEKGLRLFDAPEQFVPEPPEFLREREVGQRLKLIFWSRETLSPGSQMKPQDEQLLAATQHLVRQLIQAVG